MSDYGISQNQPIQRYNYPVVGKKKENKQENMQKAATCTLATVAGVVLTMLVGYGIVNKGGSAKKVVDGAKKGAREVARKGIEQRNESQTKLIQTLLKNLDQNVTYSPQEARKLKKVLTIYKKNLILFKNIDLTDVTKAIDVLIVQLTKFIDDNNKAVNINTTTHRELIEAKSSLTDSLKNIDEIIKVSYNANQEEFNEIQNQIKDINVEIEDSEVQAETPVKKIPFTDNKKILDNFKTEDIKVETVSVEKDSDNNFYLVLDANNLSGFEVSSKESFEYIFNPSNDKKDCYLFKLDSSIDLKKLDKLITNEQIKNTLIGYGYLEDYLTKQIKNISQQSVLVTASKDLLDVIKKIDTTENDGLKTVILKLKTALNINQLKYGPYNNIFKNFESIGKLYISTNEQHLNLDKGGQYVEEPSENGFSIDVKVALDTTTVTITDNERNLQYTYSKNTSGKESSTLDVQYNPFKNFIELFQSLAECQLQDESLKNDIESSTISAFKEYIENIDPVKLNYNSKKALNKLKSAKDLNTINQIIEGNPNAMNFIIQNTNENKQYKNQGNLNKFLTDTSNAGRMQSYLLSMFNQSCNKVYIELLGFDKKSIGEFNINQKDPHTIYYTSNEATPKTYNVQYDDTGKKVSVNDGNKTYTYDTQSGTYKVEPGDDEKAKVDLFVFYALPNAESKIRFAKAQIAKIISSGTKIISMNDKKKLTFFVTYIANNDNECKLNSLGNEDPNNSIQQIWTLLCQGYAYRGKGYNKTLNTFYIEQNGNLAFNKPTTNGEKYLEVHLSTIDKHSIAFNRCTTK